MVGSYLMYSRIGAEAVSISLCVDMNIQVRLTVNHIGTVEPLLLPVHRSGSGESERVCQKSDDTSERKQSSSLS